jgi:hypothetical protein
LISIVSELGASPFAGPRCGGALPSTTRARSAARSRPNRVLEPLQVRSKRVLLLLVDARHEAFAGQDLLNRPSVRRARGDQNARRLAADVGAAGR